MNIYHITLVLVACLTVSLSAQTTSDARSETNQSTEVPTPTTEPTKDDQFNVFLILSASFCLVFLGVFACVIGHHWGWFSSPSDTQELDPNEQSGRIEICIKPPGALLDQYHLNVSKYQLKKRRFRTHSKTKTQSTKKEYECAICLQGFQNLDPLYELPCHHLFHRQCFDQWLEHGSKCPLCQFELDRCSCTDCRRLEDQVKIINENFDQVF